MGLDGSLYADKPNTRWNKEKQRSLEESDYYKSLPLVNGFPIIEDNVEYIELKDVPWTDGCCELAQIFDTFSHFFSINFPSAQNDDVDNTIEIQLTEEVEEALSKIDWLPEHLIYTMKLAVEKGFKLYWQCG